jgi:hypothetical protein
MVVRLTSSAGILLAQSVVAVRKAHQQGLSEQQLVIIGYRSGYSVDLHISLAGAHDLLTTTTDERTLKELSRTGLIKLLRPGYTWQFTITQRGFAYYDDQDGTQST